MSHILEEYAKNLGVNIGKPIVQKHFFPLRCDKFITINGDCRIPAKNYPFYSLVIRLLKERLGGEVSIFQLGGANKPIAGADKVLDGLTFKQYAYILSRSSLHIGPDNVFMHYASSQNIPLVTLFGNVYPETTQGFWSEPLVRENILAPWKTKPCLMVEDSERAIEKITPENIVNSSLRMLGDKEPIDFKTISIGENFAHQVIEIIPKMYVPLSIFGGNVLNIRTDMGGNSDAVLGYCFNHPVNIISDSQVIPLETLSRFRKNLHQITIFADKNTGEIPIEYLEGVKKMGAGVKILVREKDILNSFRAKYFDFDVDFFDPPKERPDSIPENAMFYSNKMMVEGENIYPSRAHWKNYQKSVDNSSNIIDNPMYWEDLEHFFIYERN